MIFRRALQREFSRTAAAVFIALFAILISTVLIRLLGQAAGGRVPADAVLALIGFGSLAQLPTVLSLTLFIAGPSQVTLPRQMFTGIRENINPTIAAVATLLTLFTTALMLALEWIRRRRN